jgi:ABC-type uncharacterized transport system substrate-binding protein
MRRREFIAVLGATATWPLAARAQQPAMPVVGFVNAASSGPYARMLSAFLKGLSETGYIEDQNVKIEYRWAQGEVDRLPALVADLVHRDVAVIAATGTPAALAAKAATTTIPIVFETGSDPVQLGLVTSLNRPSGNVTGVAQLATEVAPKRLELLHEMIPKARIIALLADPTDRAIFENTTRGVKAAAGSLGLELHVLNASADSDLDAVFPKLIELRAGGLVISGGQFFNSRSKQLAATALRYAVPTISPYVDLEANGLILNRQGDRMRRRDFLIIACGSLVPTVVPAQTSFPIVAFLGSRSSTESERSVSAFREGLAESGFTEGKNISILFRWADGSYERLPRLAAELVDAGPAVIVAAGGAVSAIAAKHATSTIPIVFTGVTDPVGSGLVRSLNRPQTNVTGMALFTSAIEAKRLELLSELIPNLETVAVLINPNNPNAQLDIEAIKGSARALSLKLHVGKASNGQEIEPAFQDARSAAQALTVTSDPFFTSRRRELVHLSLRYKLPTIYQFKEFVEEGGLMSYGADIIKMYRQVGSYTGRILKGENPADLPVQQPTEFDLSINLGTAKALGLAVPPTLLVRANELIE